MEYASDIKALFVVVNAGFADEVMDVVRAAGAGGATIINARGEGVAHKSFMGITIDTEKEMVLTLVKADIAERIMEDVKEKAGIKTPAHGICFMLPTEKVTQINNFEPKNEK